MDYNTLPVGTLLVREIIFEQADMNAAIGHVDGCDCEHCHFESEIGDAFYGVRCGICTAYHRHAGVRSFCIVAVNDSGQTILDLCHACSGLSLEQIHETLKPQFLGLRIDIDTFDSYMNLLRDLPEMEDLYKYMLTERDSSSWRFAEIEAVLACTQIKRSKARRRTGYIYVLESDDGYYKIGQTGSLQNRVKALKIQLPFKVHLLHRVAVSDPSAAERQLHQRFKDRRMNGEWFRLSQEDVEWLTSLTREDLEETEVYV